jgi:dodecin
MAVTRAPLLSWGRFAVSACGTTVSIPIQQKEAATVDNVYSISEVVGTSPDSVEQAIRNGINRAAQTLRNLDWFEVVSIRGQIADGDLEHFQVQMKIGFRME